MKIATLKTSHHLALCASILLTIPTFSIAADDGDEPPLTPTTKNRLTAYDPLFKEISAIHIKRPLEINKAVRRFLRSNSQGDTPTLDILTEFWSRLENAQKTHDLSTDVVMRIDTCLVNWQTYLTAPPPETEDPRDPLTK